MADKQNSSISGALGGGNIISTLISGFFKNKRNKKAKRLAMERNAADRQFNLTQLQNDKNYKDSIAKNLLTKTLSDVNAGYGAYGISTKTGSGAVYKNRIQNEAAAEQNQRNKIFNLNVDKVNSGYNFNNQQTLFNYKNERFNNTMSTVNGIESGVGKFATSIVGAPS